jgi:endonuclease IV
MAKYKIGMKIFSTNKASFSKLRELYDKGMIDYVELSVIIGVYDEESLSVLKGVPIVFHSDNDANIVDGGPEFEESLATLDKMSSFFDEKRVIFHTGLEKDENDIKALKAGLMKLKDRYDVILENVFKEPVFGNRRLVAAKFEEFEEIVKETGAKCCLDFGHAICSANFYKEDPFDYIRKHLSLGPCMFHISDGHMSGVVDAHEHLFEGDFPLEKILGFMPEGSLITLETPKEDFENLSDALPDIDKLRQLLGMG